MPITLALFEMAAGEAERAVWYAVNFGRDADTLGTMIGGLCGAFVGASGLPARWVQKVEADPQVEYKRLAARLAAMVRQRAQEAEQYARLVQDMA